jgi:hypothetical protein
LEATLQTLLRIEPVDVHARLTELGLDVESLTDVVSQGYYAFVSCSPNHPRLIPGIWAWGETVRALREYTLPKGWSRSDENNYAVVIDPPGEMAIAVATGDAATGIKDLVPTTKANKGPSTADAVQANHLQLLLFGDLPIPSAANDDGAEKDRLTWLLLVHRAASEVRCELSLPVTMGADGKVSAWKERILLPAIPLDGDRVEIAPPDQPDINIDVKRRA